MNLFLKYNFELTCRALLDEKLAKYGLQYTINNAGHVHFANHISRALHQEISADLSKYGIEIVADQKVILVQKIKNLIKAVLHQNIDMPLVNISTFLSEQLNESYRSLAQTFSAECHISIEHFVILHKIERVKQLLINENLSLTEISYKLHYSSVAHLSNQFKKSTGLTPTAFQRLLSEKRHLNVNSNHTNG